MSDSEEKYSHCECSCPIIPWWEFQSCKRCRLLYNCCSSEKNIRKGVICHCNLHVWVDGCCLNNGQPYAQGGIGVWFNDGHELNYSSPLRTDEVHTSQKAELHAAITAVLIIRRIFTNADLPTDECTIHIDSRYVIDVTTNWVYKWRRNGWLTTARKPVGNREVIEELLNLLELCEEEHIRIKFHWIPRELNNKADELAKLGAVMNA
jgi:ribonuclease HI